jgi:hypothetical protein
VYLRHFQRFLLSYADIVIDTSADAVAYAAGLPQQLLAGTRVSSDALVAAVDAVQRTGHVGTAAASVPLDSGQDSLDVHAPLNIVAVEPAGAPPLDPEDEAASVLRAAADSLRAFAGAQHPPSRCSSSLLMTFDVLHSEVPPIRVRHGDQLINEYEQPARLMEGMFPTMFLFGCPYREIPKKAEMAHLVNQADGRAGNNLELVLYLFNMRARSEAARSVVAKWRSNPQLFDEFQRLVRDPTLPSRLESAARAPSTPAAREILRVVSPLLAMTSKRVQFGSSGANSSAFAEIRNFHRFFGPGGAFVTVNPVLSDHVLPLRLAQPLLDNFTDLRGDRFVLPETHEARRSQLLTRPLGASRGYLWFYYALCEAMLGMPTPRPDEGPKHTTELPPNTGPEGPLRRRSAYGPVSAFYCAQEASAAGAQHLHMEVYSPISWPFTRSVVHEPPANEALGRYYDSIACSSLPYGPTGWDWAEQPWQPPPSNWQPPPSAVRSPDRFASRHAFIASHKQNHLPHNFSCFKRAAPSTRQGPPQVPVPSAPTPVASALAAAQTRSAVPATTPSPAAARMSEALCRFMMPQHSWDQQTGFCQLELVQREQDQRSGGPPAPTQRAPSRRREVKIRHVVDQAPSPDHDRRILSLIFTRPSSRDTPLRTFSGLADSADQENNLPRPPRFHADDDPLDRNSWFVDSSQVVTVVTYAQNNWQLISEEGMGGDAYIAKYLVKSEIDLAQSLSLLLDAIRVSQQRPSVAPDAATNEARPTLRLLQRLINNHTRSVEIPITLCLSSLLGMAQFSSSHNCKSVWLGSAVRHVRSQLQQQRRQVIDNEDSGTDEELGVPRLVPDDDVEWEMELDETVAGDVARDQAGNAVIVIQALDYAYRDERLADLNLLEFACLLQKVPSDPASPLWRPIDGCCRSQFVRRRHHCQQPVGLLSTTTTTTTTRRSMMAERQQWRGERAVEVMPSSPCGSGIPNTPLISSGNSASCLCPFWLGSISLRRLLQTALLGVPATPLRPIASERQW